MAKVILICGKICSGKTFYAKSIAKKENAVILSSDELISELFHPNENDFHDKNINHVHEYLKNKAVQIVNSGTSVIFDWGFWTKSGRNEITEYFCKQNIKVEWHFIDITESRWKENIENRNKDVLANKTKDYFVDEGLLNKLKSKFEKPTKDEIDIWVKNQAF